MQSSPEALWDLVADTNRFNQDTHLLPVTIVNAGERESTDERYLIRTHGLKLFGRRFVPLEWEEEPFEWVHPYRFGVERNHRQGPLKQLRTMTELIPQPDGGTLAVYEVWATPSATIFIPAVLLQIGLISRIQFRRVFYKYDRLAQQPPPPAFESVSKPQIAPGGLERLEAARKDMAAFSDQPELVDRLVEFLRAADDMTLAQIRPYLLADYWAVSRRHLLETCLLATRAGLLDFRWDLLCPRCRGAKLTGKTLSEIVAQVHCDACQIDFTVNFDQSVELTFRPNPAIRRLEVTEFCIGGPMITPHIQLQRLLTPGESFQAAPVLNSGRYRLRTLKLPGAEHMRVNDEGGEQTAFAIGAAWRQGEATIAKTPTLTFTNQTDEDQLVILERTTWSDQIVTAAEVTGLQLFRDLFANEALRPGEQISVGTLTVVFTDLCMSTQLYREVGDAPAFGLVMQHFDVLREAIAQEDGAIVKTIGDAVMAVFRQPVNALRAILKAQEILLSPSQDARPLMLKAGIHSGTSIAVTLNDRLDYFGTTVNLAARLEKFSSGKDIIISQIVHDDPEVKLLLNQRDVTLSSEQFAATVRGFDQEEFDLWRVTSTWLQGVPVGADESEAT